MTTTTILLCGITNNGNAVATTEDGSSRFLLTKTGDFKTGAELQFPSYILQDRMTGEADAETLLKNYAEQKAAEKAAEDQAKARKEDFSKDAIIRRFSSFARVLDVIAEYEAASQRRHAEFAAFKANPAELRKALKKAEAATAKQKELDAFKKICDKALASLKKSGPKFPLKGAGFQREDFPTVGNNKKMQLLFAAIPSNHKDEISSRRQKGYFSWSPIISLEAAKKVTKLIDLANS